MRSLTPAEVILNGLGITDAREIDLEAIAWELGASVKYRPLEKCEARIVGNGDKAIITINSNSMPRRQRFSLGHELGHWRHHRHRLLMCQDADIGGSQASTSERTANSFASELLMPTYLFEPAARGYAHANFQTVRAIGDLFDISMTATTIRLIERGFFTGFVICHNRQGRQWFVRSPDVPDRWFPRDDLSADSFAFDILFGSGADDRFPRKIAADDWFDRPSAGQYEVQEQTIRVADDHIVTLLLINDHEMLDDAS